LTTICATSDIHSPQYLELFKKALANSTCKPDLFILAGDIVERNNIAEYRRVIELINSVHPDVPVAAVFGNEEYIGSEKEYIMRYPNVIFLHDNYRVIDTLTGRIVAVGSRGALDKPTRWQAKNMPGLIKYFRDLPDKISSLINQAASTNLPIILVTHYGVTYRNLTGENLAIHPYLASRRMENVIVNHRNVLKAVIHGHAHNGLVESINIDSVKVYNVALPARGRIIKVEV